MMVTLDIFFVLLHVRFIIGSESLAGGYVEVVKFRYEHFALCHVMHEKKNFGDSLGPVLVKNILKLYFNTTLVDIPVLDYSYGSTASKQKESTCLFHLGSVFHLTKPLDHIWGSGVSSSFVLRGLPHGLVYHAIRGPLTADYISKNTPSSVMDIPFGDPAVLLSVLGMVGVAACTPGVNCAHSFCVVPHFNDYTVKSGARHVPYFLLVINIIKCSYCLAH